MDINSFRKLLIRESDELYASFVLPLLPGISRPVLGVRMPKLRKIVTTILQGEWQQLLSNFSPETYEEQVAIGLIIGMADMTWEERKEKIINYINIIDNWGACDAFVASLKVFKEETEDQWDFIKIQALSTLPYHQRFAAVSLLWHFISEKNLDRVLDLLLLIHPKKYYARMGVAWALCECFIKNPEKVYPLFTTSNIDKDTLRMTLRKIKESLRTPIQWKEKIKLIS